MKTIYVDWFITGYQIFKTTPGDNEKLRMFVETNNPVDPYALLVKDGNGRSIGRVPANLCRAFIRLKEEDLACDFTCTFKNLVYRVQNYERAFKRNVGGWILLEVGQY